MDVGQAFGGYRLDAQLGRGGMGVVYAAWDTVRERRVALKVLAPHLVDDEHFRARFLREARTVAGLSSPHIVPVHDFGVVDGLLFLDMALVDGRDLAALLAAGPLAPERAVAVVEQVADALDAAHERGLVHRDVKPANVLLARRRHDQPDFAYLTDFGLARSVVPAPGSEGLTMDGTVVGTADYMSPEQIEGGAVDARSDVYALGCLLYHCLAGRPPYARSNPVLVLDAHRSAPVPALPEGMSWGGLESVLATAMAKDPAQRFAGAGDLAAAARAALLAAPTASQAPTMIGPRPPSGPLPLVGVGTAAAAVPSWDRGAGAPTPTPTPGPTPAPTPGPVVAPPPRRRPLGTGAVVGIVLGAVAVLVVVAGLGAFAVGSALQRTQGGSDPTRTSGSSGSSGSPTGTSGSSGPSETTTPTTLPNPALGATAAGALLPEDEALLPRLPKDLVACQSAALSEAGGQTSTSALSCEASSLDGTIVNVLEFADEAARDTAFNAYTMLDTNSLDGCPNLDAAGPWLTPTGEEGGTAACYDVPADSAQPDGARYAVMAWTVTGQPMFLIAHDPSQPDAAPLLDWQQAWAADYSPTTTAGS